MASREYGINIAMINEIRMIEPQTLLPNTPSYVKGVINVRGSIVPIIDLLVMFREHSDYPANKLIIIILNINSGGKNRNIGILVDNVNDTYTVNSAEIKQSDEDRKLHLKNYILGLVNVNDKMITLLKPDSFAGIFENQEAVS